MTNTTESVTSEFSTIESHLVVVAYAIIAILGILTNMIIFGLIVLRDNLRTASNLLILNLAMSDILMAALSPVTLAALVSQSWIYGTVLCKLLPFVQGIQIFVSSLTVSTIALDRMLLITDCCLSKWRPGTSTKSIILTTVVIWTLAISLSSPVIIAYHVEIGDPAIFGFDKCLTSRNRSYLIIYTGVILVVQFILPTITLVTSYSAINRFLAGHRSRDPSSNQADQVTTSFGTETENLATPGGQLRRTLSGASHDKRDYHRNRRAVLTLMAIWLCFVISWSPWNILQVYIEILPNFDLSPRQFNRLYVICHLMAMSSTVANGILYGFLNTNIRAELILMRVRLTAFLINWNDHRSDQNV